MKKTYQAPKLSSHGTVENLTNAYGSTGKDTISGPAVPNGSVTGIGTANFCQTPNDVNCQKK